MNSVSLIAWLIAGVCFIFSLGGLSQHESSRRGNWLGITGMAIAIIAALFSGRVAFSGWFLLIPAIIAGAAAGAYLAGKVEMTAMPQLVAILHSFVGLAAVLVGISAFVHPHNSGHMADAMHVAAEAADTVVATEPGKEIVVADTSDANHSAPGAVSGGLIHNIEIILGVFIGGLTFTGSIIAWGKLDGRIDSKPMLLPARHWLNLAALFIAFLFSIWFLNLSLIHISEPTRPY